MSKSASMLRSSMLLTRESEMYSTCSEHPPAMATMPGYFSSYPPGSHACFRFCSSSRPRLDTCFRPLFRVLESVFSKGPASLASHWLEPFFEARDKPCFPFASSAEPWPLRKTNAEALTQIQINLKLARPLRYHPECQPPSLASKSIIRM